MEGKQRRYPSDPQERIKVLIAEGKMGPQFGRLGGRPPRPATANGQVAAAARANASTIVAVLEDLLKRGSKAQRLSASRTLLEAERLHRQQERAEEEQESREMTRDQLIDALSKSLSSGTTGLLLQQRQLGADIEGEAIEIDRNGDS